MSEVVTFYSYKGGVGRSMALANVSVMLSKWGHKVLVVDWDLEAPGLEQFYKEFIDVKIVESTLGVIDLLQIHGNNKWKDCIIPITIANSKVPISFISSGKRNQEYFKNIRRFDVDIFYENGGGEIIEQLRNEWLANYDYILIDSRTGITEIGGICTIQLPDTVVMLFTATNQGFEGVLDITRRASAAQQKLVYNRQKLIFLPIPSKFETNTEFKLSQKWLDIFAKKLEESYNDWLPVSVNRKDFLELTKIPYIAYFSFGESLPVIEQGVKDPSGLGYAYESLSAIIGNHLNDIDLLINDRDQYISQIDKTTIKQDIIREPLISNDQSQDFDFYQEESVEDLEQNRFDVFVLGSVGVGKSAFIAGILFYAYRNGNLRIKIDNRRGYLYGQSLINSIESGFLPSRTPLDFFQYVACDFEDQDNSMHPFNFIEMSGENFSYMYGKKIEEIPFALQKYFFKSSNLKIFFLCIEFENQPNARYSVGKTQSLVIDYWIHLLENSDLFKITKGICIVITKWDQNILRDEISAENYLKMNYPNLFNTCKNYADKYLIQFSIYTYSLGEFDPNNSFKYKEKDSSNVYKWLCSIPYKSNPRRTFWDILFKSFPK